MMMKMMNRKKKGFTLIELIAVIAILGILVAIIVPRIGQYSASAKLSKEKANAKIILNAFETYNSTATTTLSDSTKMEDMDATSDFSSTGDSQAYNALIKAVKEVEDLGGKIKSTTTIQNLIDDEDETSYDSYLQ